VFLADFENIYHHMITMKGSIQRNVPFLKLKQGPEKSNQEE